MVYIVAAAGAIILSIVYWRNSRLLIWSREPKTDAYQEFMDDTRAAMESNDNILGGK